MRFRRRFPNGEDDFKRCVTVVQGILFSHEGTFRIECSNTSRWVKRREVSSITQAIAALNLEETKSLRTLID